MPPFYETLVCSLFSNDIPPHDPLRHAGMWPYSSSTFENIEYDIDRKRDL